MHGDGDRREGKGGQNRLLFPDSGTWAGPIKFKDLQLNIQYFITKKLYAAYSMYIIQKNENNTTK